jgi:hypothetical protein
MLGDRGLGEAEVVNQVHDAMFSRGEVLQQRETAGV